MSIDPAHIARLAALMERHGLATLDYDLGGAALSLRMAPSATAAPRGAPSPVAASESASAPVETPGTRLIPSPHVGFFRTHHPAGGPPPSLPRVIKAGEIIGYVEALGLVHAITAESGGTLTAARVAEGEPVGYGTALFEATD